MAVKKDRKHSRLYRYIERLHEERPWGEKLSDQQKWGAVLDAGSGPKSISWIESLATERWTAVTGADVYEAHIRKTVGEKERPQDNIVLGNWADPNLLKGEVFDTVLADYLLGAVEAFAPYFQPYLFKRLRPMTRNVLYITGLEPYVPTARPTTEDGRLVWEIGRFRDACITLGGGRPYREYPAQWVVDQVNAAGFAVRDLKHFESRYKNQFVNAQIDWCAPALDAVSDRKLAAALHARGEALRAEALAFVEKEGALKSCRNYVIAAEPLGSP